MLLRHVVLWQVHVCSMRGLRTYATQGRAMHPDQEIKHALCVVD
jgi:hypothetical protein